MPRNETERLFDELKAERDRLAEPVADVPDEGTIQTLHEVFVEKYGPLCGRALVEARQRLQSRRSINHLTRAEAASVLDLFDLAGVPDVPVSYPGAYGLDGPQE